MADSQALRDRIDAALSQSTEGCPRCKTCDTQTDAVMAAIAEAAIPLDRHGLSLVGTDELAELRERLRQAEAALARARTAQRRLSAKLIASAHLLDVPYSNAPELTPWSRSIRPAMADLRAALDVPADGEPPPPPATEETDHV